MKTIKQFLRKVPGLAPAYRRFRSFLQARQLRKQSSEEVFTAIFQSNQWGGVRSVSGAGSDEEQTRSLIHSIPDLLNDLKIRSILDIPCGDFYWMKDVDLSGIDYTGGDIVRELVDRNQQAYGSPLRRFLHLDLLKGPLPRVDVILCRDCFVHFSNEDVQRALQTMRESGSRYLLSTTFTEHTPNTDIATGQWRPLNLERPPFRFRRPVRLVDEECTLGGGIYRDKALGLWLIESLHEDGD